LSTDTRPIVFPSLQTSGESDGFTRGHAAGYAAGLRKAEVEANLLRAHLEAQKAAALKEGQRRLAAAVALLEAAATALRARTAPVLAEADDALTAAGLALAEAVLGRELSDATMGAKAALGRAFSVADSEAIVAVRLHPADLALLTAERATTTQVTLVADPSLTRGDAVAEYPDGELDARIGTALARARAALAGETL
jgi:flagellar assembly protein FliH